MAGVRCLIVCLVEESLLAVASVVAVASAVALVSAFAVVTAFAVTVAVAVGSLLQVQLLSSLPLPTCPGTGTLEHLFFTISNYIQEKNPRGYHKSWVLTNSNCFFQLDDSIS